MLRNSDGETEILLGNKQLLGIFVVVVVLLGVAFAGGYKVGQSSHKATLAAGPVDDTTTSAAAAGETHSLPADSASASNTSPDQSAPAPTPGPVSPSTEPPAETPAPEPHTRSLGEHVKTTKKPVPVVDSEAPGPAAAAPVASDRSFAPQGGQTFLQVAAVSREEAEGIADVLRKKGFHAHAVPKPGSNKIYRVIIGPVRDATDLNATRGLLRNTGFREIFVQRY